MGTPKIQKSLEIEFFKRTFKQIKNHFLFKNLSLSNEEIIENRHEIKKTLDSWSSCEDNHKFCSSLNPHYEMIRNGDNQLILKTVFCSKTKLLDNIPSEEIKKQTYKYLKYGGFDVNKHNIHLIKEHPKANKVIENLGNHAYQLKNSFIFEETKKDELVALYALHSILSGHNTCVIKSGELKDICTQNSFQFKKQEVEEYLKKYKQISSIKNLIIVDFGLESETYKKLYYLDLFPEFLNTRKSLDKTTHIITPISFELIEVEMLNKNSSDLITCHKIKNLKKVMQMLFSRLT